MTALLSVDGCHASEMVVAVASMTATLAGIVGAMVSFPFASARAGRSVVAISNPTASASKRYCLLHVAAAVHIASGSSAGSLLAAIARKGYRWHRTAAGVA